MLKIIQITDTHLFKSDDGEIFGVKSNIAFYSVIQKILEEDIKETDFILLTGDISQDESTESYQKLVNSLERFNLPIYWIPGNHDDLSLMTSVFKQCEMMSNIKSVSHNNWRFIFINTKLDGKEYGHLHESELSNLKTELSGTDPDKNIVIVMHHHPHEVKTPLIDEYILKNRADLWATLSGHNIKLIICGHVHGDYSIMKDNVMIESSPATCLQWVKGTESLNVDPRIGYKIYHFDTHNYKAVTRLW